MEENKQEKHTPPAQKFYFNEEGKLVVETNKGVWVDGEQYAKMYGSFVCNTKTMGIIIQAMKGIPVEVGVEEKVRHTHDWVVDDILNVSEHTLEHYCILGVDKKRINEYLEELAVKEYSNTEIRKARDEKDKWFEVARQKENDCYTLEKKCDSLFIQIERYNKLPWYKRIFKKIKIDEK